jgi:hypothetical protein
MMVCFGGDEPQNLRHPESNRGTTRRRINFAAASPHRISPRWKMSRRYNPINLAWFRGDRFAVQKVRRSDRHQREADLLFDISVPENVGA